MQRSDSNKFKRYSNNINESNDMLRQNFISNIKKDFETTNKPENLKRHFADAKLQSPNRSIIKANIEAINKKQ